MAEQINLSIFSPSLTADTPALPGTFPQNRIRAAFSWLHLYRGFWLFSLLLASCMIIFSAKYYPTYQVLLNGNPLGMVAQKEDLAPALSEAEATASQLLGRKYHFPSTEVSYRLVYTYGNQYSSSAALQNALLNSVDEIRLLYVLRVDGTPVGASPSQFILLQSLQKILHTYQGENVQSVQFANAVSIHQEYVHKSMEKTGSQILSALQGKTENNQIYAAQPGDTLQSISNAIDVPLEILCKLNPDLIGETIAKPRTILLNEAPPLLSVYVKNSNTYGGNPIHNENHPRRILV
ncbi:MAG: LysM peptidoglycan-binding domain-containing protein [Oscillospiraceae bacterium]|nr:LysM peptidoglycan-binding domain-containing protein [Oscillospiraceae bacterium]